MDGTDNKTNAKKLGQYLRALRKERGMNRPTVETTARNIHSVELSANYLYKIEAGERDLTNAALPVREALRQIYGVTREDWTKATGLFVPNAEVASTPMAPVVYRVSKPITGDQPINPDIGAKIAVDPNADPEQHDGIYLYKLKTGDYVTLKHDNPLRPSEGLVGRIKFIEF